MKKKYCFDLDGVICNNTFGDYDSAIPYPEAIKKINELYEEGNEIIIFTARYMGKFKGNVGLVYNFGYESTKNQLKNWNLKFHNLIMGKVEYDIFIDDKNLNYPLDWWNHI